MVIYCIQTTMENLNEKIGNVPENLPCEEKNDINPNINIKIPKKRIGTFLKAFIIVVIILISFPRMVNNVSSTLSLVDNQAKKFPEFFPNLALVGTSLGDFGMDVGSKFADFVKNNLADMAEIFYSRKITGSDTEVIESNQIEEKAKPVRIIAESVGIDSIILNPESTDITVLDEALTYGAVRYPKSGLLGDNDNIYIFGHSTSIKTVRNQAYKALNGLKDLKAGDEIKLLSEQREYIYKVTAVTQEKNTDAIVRFNTGKRTLTLSTCNTLGAKEDRYIVTADFVASYPIATTVTSNTTTNNNENQTQQQNQNTITQGAQTEITVPINPSGNQIQASNPNGKVDLSAQITEVGYIDSITKEFIATSTPKSSDKIAFKFVISNIGTKTAEGWSFSTVIPTMPLYIYQSNTQQNLAPGERIEYMMGFDKGEVGTDKAIIVNVDPTRSIFESNEDNNITKKIINIIK